MPYHIYHNLIVKSPQQAIFDAFTMPEHLEKWWPLKCTGIPKEGVLYNFNFTDEYDWYAVVTNLSSNVACSWKMTKSDPDWSPTSFGFELEQRPEGCLVRFFHLDWNELNNHYKTASFCWAILLNGLKDYVESGKVIPFENRS